MPTAIRETHAGAQMTLEDRVEAVCRQICRANGYNPDKEMVLVPRDMAPLTLGDMIGYEAAWATPMPMWSAYVPSVRQVLQAAVVADRE